MENIIIPGHIDITEQMLKDVCKQIEIDQMKAIIRISFCKKHGDQVGIKVKRFDYQEDMWVKVTANRGDSTVIMVDPFTIPVTGKLSEDVQEEKQPQEQLEELNSAV